MLAILPPLPPPLSCRSSHLILSYTILSSPTLSNPLLNMNMPCPLHAMPRAYVPLLHPTESLDVRPISNTEHGTLSACFLLSSVRIPASAPVAPGGVSAYFSIFVSTNGIESKCFPGTPYSVHTYKPPAPAWGMVSWLWPKLGPASSTSPPSAATLQAANVG